MARLLDKYVFQVLIVFTVGMGVLIGVLGAQDGVRAGGKATDLAGTSFGAVLGFIPRFFTHVRTGQQLAAPKAPSASQAPANKQAPAAGGGD